jgi:hypothetical protein
MQKIISQDLSGSETEANKIAEYTWEEGEIAWLFDYDKVYRVIFTGKRWIIGNKWGRNKIYQFKYLEGSCGRDVKYLGLDNDGISHSNEDMFYTTKQEALTRCYRYIDRVKQNAIEEHYKTYHELKKYEEKE